MAVLGFALLAMTIFIADLLIKNHIEHTINEGEEESLCGGKLLLRRHHNRGAILNAGQDRQGLVSVMSLVLTLGTTVLFLTTFTLKGSRMLKTGLAFLLGGAYSNTYDRLTRKYVVDYVSFPVNNKKIRNIVFNISDFCIIIGAFLIVIGNADIPSFDRKHTKKWRKMLNINKKKWNKKWHAAKRHAQKYLEKKHR